MNQPFMSFAGWVGNDVELAVTRTGVPVVNFRVAYTPRVMRDGTWVDGETMWHTVKAWRGLAENLAASVRQGDPVIVTGRLTAETWVREDNTKTTKLVVVASTVGHDLSRGTAVFTKAARADAIDEAQQADDDSAVNEAAAPEVSDQLATVGG